MADVVIPKKSTPIDRALKVRLDAWIALATASLVIAGFMVVYSSSFDLAFQAHNDPFYYLRTQVIAGLLGLAGIVAIMQMDYHHLRKLSIPILGLTVALLILVLVVGEESFGAQRNINLFGVSIQPSEIAKLTMILYTAHWLSSKGDRVKSFTFGLAPFAVMVGVVGFLVAQQPHLSAAALIAAVCFTLFFLAGADWRHFALALALAIGVFILMIFAWPHATFRLETWRQTLLDPNNAPYQIRLAVILLGSGGLWGRGMGAGVNKYLLPAAHTDGVFAVWGEEVGFVGSLFVLGMFALLAWRGIMAARQARSTYGYLLALGITVWFSYQALMNIAVITSTIPFTGMPIPFMSYGGSSLTVSLLGAGVLLNVSRDSAIGKTLREPDVTLGALREDTDLRRRNGRPHLSRPGRRH